MPILRTKARKDDNHDDIVNALRKIGAVVISIHQLKDAFDILVAYRGKLFVVEIKDGNKPPSKRKLTEGEVKCKNKLEGVGVTYNIVYSVDEAIELVTKIKNNVGFKGC